MTVATKKLTLKDMSRLLNVSTASISNAFNRPDQLSADLRRHILSECKRLGYHGPNSTARSLRTGKSDIIGVVLADTLTYSFADPVANQFLQGVAEELDQQHLHMLLLSSEPGPDSATPKLPDSLVDGFIVYGAPGDASVMPRILQQQKPVVTVDFEYADCPFVHVGNYKGALDSARHALKTRPEQVAVLGLRLVESDRVCRIYDDELLDEESSVSNQRLGGYLQALNEFDIQLSNSWIWNVPINSVRFAQQAAKEAMMSHPRPDLIFCMSDRIAQGVAKVALELGLRIPQDLRIVGFDDIPEASLMTPALTTVHQQSQDKGRLAARLFMGQEQSPVELETELMVRDSCP